MKITTHPIPPEGHEWHNPDNIRPELVEYEEGYRLLLKAEIGGYVNKARYSLESYLGGERWEPGNHGCHLSSTYRTKCQHIPDRPKHLIVKKPFHPDLAKKEFQWTIGRTYQTKEGGQATLLRATKGGAHQFLHSNKKLTEDAPSPYGHPLEGAPEAWVVSQWEADGKMGCSYSDLEVLPIQVKPNPIQFIKGLYYRRRDGRKALCDSKHKAGLAKMICEDRPKDEPSETLLYLRGIAAGRANQPGSNDRPYDVLDYWSEEPGKIEITELPKEVAAPEIISALTQEDFQEPWWIMYDSKQKVFLAEEVRPEGVVTYPEGNEPLIVDFEALKKECSRSLDGRHWSPCFKKEAYFNQAEDKLKEANKTSERWFVSSTVWHDGTAFVRYDGKDTWIHPKDRAAYKALDLKTCEYHLKDGSWKEAFEEPKHLVKA